MPHDYLAIARRLLQQPTAAFHEHYVVAAVVGLAADLGAALQADAAGNLTLRVQGAVDPGLCLTAHLDHPALGFGRLQEEELLFERLGGVPDEFTAGARVRIFDAARAGDGRVPEPLTGGTVTARPAEVEATVPTYRVRPDEAVQGDRLFAVWDLPDCELDGSRLIGTACDDLAGAAVALAVLDRCRDKGIALSVLLTRAEETGFGGMLAAVADHSLPPAELYVNIECSSCLAGAPLGDGPVVRVGDKRWLFDAPATGALDAAGEAVDKARDGGAPVQRRLMGAGTCEATPLQRSGRATGAVALPLDNYHNHGGDRLRAEAVDLEDARTLVDLLAELAGSGPMVEALQRPGRRLDEQLDERRQAQMPRLIDSRASLPLDPASPAKEMDG
jgi:putative aminopeptidase FrvX